MLKTISEALENFCIHQIRIPHTLSDGVLDNESFIAYIDINAQSGKTHRVYIASDTNFMQRISNIFLEETQSDKETLIDMTLETANLIVGSAKVIAEERNDNPYTICTPFFLKTDRFDFEYDQAKFVNIDNDKLMIAIKELC